MNISMKNADRFLGFADTYEQARPHMPLYPIEVITNYLNTKPDVVIDLGCGTGLSTTVWKNYCNTIIGIEPNDDMLLVALKKADNTILFRKAFSNETGLDKDYANVVICSQSFHWMEPNSTLSEVDRILKSGGIFATVDCDWPPVCRWEAEKAYEKLFDRVNSIEKDNNDLKDNFMRWNKNEHLSNIKKSGFFRYYREIVFENKESCDAQRYINIALSQGGLQSIFKNKPHLIKYEVNEFIDNIHALFGDERFTIDFCYRMRIGIK